MIYIWGDVSNCSMLIWDEIFCDASNPAIATWLANWYSNRPHKTLPCASQACSISVLFYHSSTRQDAFCESHYRKLSPDLCNCGFSNLGLKITSHCPQQCCCSDLLGYNWRTKCSQMYSRLLATSSTTWKYSSPGIENCECFEKAFWCSWYLAAHLGNGIKVLDLPFKEDASTFWWYPSLAMICASPDTSGWNSLAIISCLILLQFHLTWLKPSVNKQ